MVTAAWNLSTFLFYVILELLEDIIQGLFKPRCNVNVRKYSFAYRVIDIWNSLSSDIVDANSISVFKQ